MIRSGNPALKSDAFVGSRGFGQEMMTVQGTVNKTLLLLLAMIVPASFTWQQLFNGNAALVMPLMMLGVIGGLVLSLITIFKPVWAPYTATLYAVCEGMALGGISATFEARYPGIAIQSVGATIAVAGAMLLGYKAGFLKATDRFKRGIFAVTAGLALLYLVQMVLGFFHVSIPLIFASGPVGILFSVIVAGVAALNLILDFDFIEQASRSGAPKHMEWYGGFALLVTLVWLYLEILRLLAKIQDRR